MYMHFYVYCVLVGLRPVWFVMPMLHASGHIKLAAKVMGVELSCPIQ